jgi:release factor glutamine methyltransferase
LIEAAVEHFGERGPDRILDLGTGSGALLLAALAQWPRAVGLGVDTSEAALAVAQANAERLGFTERATIAQGSWAAAATGDYDLILCNPPYIEIGTILPKDVVEYEPASALFAGSDGLAEYRRIAPALRPAKGGVACVEIGATQAGAVCTLFEAQDLLTQVKRDLAGRDRCIIVRPKS